MVPPLENMPNGSRSVAIPMPAGKSLINSEIRNPSGLCNVARQRQKRAARARASENFALPGT
jgi:hypothetical protein